MTLPRDLEIFCPSFVHQPWAKTRRGGSSPAAIRNAGQLMGPRPNTSDRITPIAPSTLSSCDSDLAKKITPAQADALEHRLKMVNHNPAKILSYVGATSIADIPAAMYPVADRMIEAIENPRK